MLSSSTPTTTSAAGAPTSQLSSMPKKGTCANGGGSCSAHAGSYQAAILHHNAAYENVCLRCGQVVYQVDKIGPLKDFTFFHHGCFKCQVCGTKLTLKTYYNNQQDQDDKEVSGVSTNLNFYSARIRKHWIIRLEKRFFWFSGLIFSVVLWISACMCVVKANACQAKWVDCMLLTYWSVNVKQRSGTV